MNPDHSTPGPGQSPIPKGATSREDRLRELGAELVGRFAAVIRIGSVYDVQNNAFQAQLEQLATALRPELRESGEIALVTLDQDLYLNGVRVPDRASTAKFIRSLIDQLLQRRIAGIRVEPGVEMEELARFFEVFLHSEERGRGLVDVCGEAGLLRIAPVAYVSTEAGEGAPWDPAAEEEEADEAFEADADAAAAGSPTRSPHAVAVDNTRALFNTTLREGLELRLAKRVIQPLVDESRESLPAVVGLSTLSHHDEYTYAHAVGVCSISVAMGQALGLDRAALTDLGVAALFHDVGKASVAEQIRHPIDEFTDAEWGAVRQHPFEGARLLGRSTVLNRTVLRSMRVALEHHRDPRGGGYPPTYGMEPMSVLSQIVAVADTFVSYQMHRSARGAEVTPHEALSMTLAELRGRFEDSLLWALVRTVGAYPPGQLVELDDGSLALVIAANPDDPARPHARVTHGPDRVPLDATQLTLYRPLPPERHVRRALGIQEYPAEFPRSRQNPENDAAAA